MPKFSIIAVDYEFHVPRQGMVGGLKSLAAQTFKDFEIIIVHDGPKTIPYEEELGDVLDGLDVTFTSTPVHCNNWGHSSRDSGMRIAKGEYIVHFNIDNMLYPFALEEINNSIDEVYPIIIFPIIHHKINALRRGYNLDQYARGEVPETRDIVFNGIPPVLANIDVLQFVARKDVWENAGYWYNLTEQSDGIIYSELCRDNNYKALSRVLGENF